MSKARQLADLGNQVDDGAITGSNMVINGAMNVAQRGVSAVTVTTSAGYSTVDRFKTDIDGSGGGDFSHAQSTDVPSGQGFQYSSKFTTVTQASQPTSEGNRHQLYTLLEEQDVFHLEWGTSNAKTCTLSFWVKGSVTGTYGFIFGHYGSGGTYYYYTNYTINSANTWEKKTITVTGPTVGGNNDGGNSFGLRVEWILGVGSDAETGTLNEWTTSSTMRTAANTVYLPETSGATLYITGVCLNVGDSAIDFPHESYADTLAKCQRYFEIVQPESGQQASGIGVGYNLSTTSAAMHYFYKVKKRTEPDFTVTGQSNIRIIHTGTSRNISSGTISISSNSGVDVGRIVLTGASGAMVDGDGSAMMFVGDGSLQFNAEL